MGAWSSPEALLELKNPQNNSIQMTILQRKAGKMEDTVSRRIAVLSGILSTSVKGFRSKWLKANTTCTVTNSHTKYFIIRYF